jgi:hypothetical protein
MRLLGLTLCLLVSSFGARAESVEDRVAALEARVKGLEEAIRSQSGKVGTNTATIVDGIYKGQTPNGDAFTAELSKGRLFVSTDKESKVGTYEVDGQRVIATVDGKTEFLRIEGEQLKGAKVELTKSK